MPGHRGLFIPGPTNVPQAVRLAMDISMEDQRAPDLPAFTLPLFADVKKVFKTDKAQVFLFPASGTGGWEAATVRVLPTNKIQVVTGTAPHGQGHETAWSMIVAEKMGVDPDDVDVLHSDTAIAPLGLDTYGSRSLPVGGVAIAMACDKVIDKAKKIAAHQLEANEDDLEFAGGSFTVKGSPDRTMPLAAIAFEAFTAHNLPDGLEPNLEAQVTYDPPNFSWPFGTHICTVEVDVETGQVEVLQYVAVDDCGVQVNPLIVEGQVHGGVIQGLAERGGKMTNMVPDGKGRCRLEYTIPSRGLIGFQTEFMSMTSGTGLLFHNFDHFGPKSDSAGIGQRRNGVLISNEMGKTAPYALFNLQERGRMMVDSAVEVYEGQVVGIHSRDNDLVVNVLKGKKLTNMRASGSDENVLLTPPVKHSLEQALEFINEDELVELTPTSIRVRKKFLKEHERKRGRSESAAA
mgnify:CR=1 FL=1